MEVGGFTVGAIALVSLLKDCVDLYSMFTSAQNLDRDAMILQTKLKIEELLFVKWSERVDLFQLRQGQNGVISTDACTRSLIKRTLEQMRELLSDGNELQKKYGLKNITPAKESYSRMVQNDDLGCISTRRRLQLATEFGKMKIKDAFPINRSPMLDSIANKITWVIGDKEKFHRLISDLSDFNRKLVELTPGSNQALSANDLSHIRNIESLNVIVEASQDNHSQQEAAITARANALVLDTLWFRWHNDRRLTVKDAHKKTFHWTLNPSTEDCKWSHLPSWLEGDSGVYWLCGKAGSGKSTLMKFLHDDERTKQYLKVWVGDSEIIFASFFFYAQGQPEQKSQVGLLRSLLYQILSRDATLSETVLPNVWKEACRGNQEKHGDLSAPSIGEMETALKDICNLYRSTKKIFFLIDGIDEYEGNDFEVAEFISKLGEFANVKVLVSGRPHPAFFRAFKQSPQMDLPDLTERDIVSYVGDTVASNPNMKELSEMDPRAVEDIIKSLVERASGVFLWVILVCRSVIEGCDAGDTTAELQARVDESPKEVEDLLRRIIETIDPCWKEEAMKIMYLVYTDENCKLTCPMPTLGLYLICEQGLNSDIYSSEIRPIKPLSPEGIQLRIKKMEIRLRSRCLGLVENRRTYYTDPSGDPSKTACCSSVHFMHRTVNDLFSNTHVFDLHFGNIVQKGFNSYFVLCNLWCHFITISQDQEAKHRLSCFYMALNMAIYADHRGCAPDIIFHCLSRVQYISGIFLIGDEDSLPKATEYFLHDAKCRQFYDDISVILALASEFFMHRTIKYVYESNAPLNHLLYQPLSIQSLSSCKDGQKKTAEGLECQQNTHYYGINTAQGPLSTRFPLALHLLLTPFTRETRSGRSVEHMGDSGLIEFLIEKDRGPIEEYLGDGDKRTELFLDRIDYFCNPTLLRQNCQRWKDVRQAIHSLLRQ
ncbi:hypothetical protein FSST1_010456 [Fusarium sambucinum]